jgi:hypothetical protein
MRSYIRKLSTGSAPGVKLLNRILSNLRSIDPERNEKTQLWYLCDTGETVCVRYCVNLSTGSGGFGARFMTDEALMSRQKENNTSSRTGPI